MPMSLHPTLPLSFFTQDALQAIKTDHAGLLDEAMTSPSIGRLHLNEREREREREREIGISFSIEC